MNARYYIHRDSDAYFNMAFDEWLLSGLERDDGQPGPILRLYTWGKPAVTFGYNQTMERFIDLDPLPEKTPVIRRITGGRAIYHDPSEITFTLLANLEIFPEDRRSLVRTNRLISETLVKIFKRVGLDTVWARQSDHKFKASNGMMKSCFGSTSQYEVASAAAKIAGGAQRRIGRFFIHQGSIKINGVSACPAIGQEYAPPPYDCPAGVEKYIGRKFCLDDFIEPFQRQFSRCLGFDFKKSQLTIDQAAAVEVAGKKLQKKRLEKRSLH